MLSYAYVFEKVDPEYNTIVYANSNANKPKRFVAAGH